MIELKIIGMTCKSCQEKIKKSLSKQKGVISVKVSLKEKKAIIKHDDEYSIDETKKIIEDLGYRINEKEKASLKEVFSIALSIATIILIIKLTVGLDVLNFIPTIDSSISMIMLFFIGLLTSVHCIGMCGSINLATVMNSTEKNIYKRPFLYNLGRVISYTFTGALVGGIGSIVSINTNFQATVIAITAFIMFFMGIYMLGWLPSGLHFLIPRLPSSFKVNSSKGPLVVGLLNGFMPCGPLQAMQIYALTTGSIFLGAFSMFAYAMGTVPLMFGFGVIFTKLKGKYNILIQRLSSVLIIFLAFFMLSRSINLMGISVPSIQTGDYSSYEIAEIIDGKQYVEYKLNWYGYQPIMVQKDIPVEFNIYVDDIRYFGCTNALTIPALDMEVSLKTGDNIIEFTPNKIGTLNYTCWMGMVSSQILVVDNLDNYKEAE